MIVMMKLYLPSPDIPIDKAVQAFKNKGLNATGMVYLPGGGHSVGIAPCVAFENRLYDFQNTGKPDPTMNTTLLKTLKKLFVHEILAVATQLISSRILVVLL
ncbi:hypothetical protein POPTR_009G019501v4 [Populus trichocarpa]|uniref:Uncharacterized protein n=1 Tax=Populus trichocarpa TaxID=3694 RepID=A0ACC0SG04_POPTR|nr:hypothetical protein BDE02_09G014100 [Populus trichocarpa]KAI9388151.1 hypothetical protein POPTR_009G019501v4 [Populus trichocarpa]